MKASTVKETFRLPLLPPDQGGGDHDGVDGDGDGGDDDCQCDQCESSIDKSDLIIWGALNMKIFYKSEYSTQIICLNQEKICFIMK